MKNKSYIFWIRSSRGTDSQMIAKLDASFKMSDIRNCLENWCDRFGAWHVSENSVSYGWAVANKTNLKKLSQYNQMKHERLKQLGLLTDNKITPKDFNIWLKKNQKKMKFPFK